MNSETEKKMIDVIKMMAPGTALREGLENILRAKTGAFIVIGDGPEITGLIDGGFRLEAPYLPSYLYELAKMDGAIVLSSDMERIIYANALVVPDTSIKTDETGTRHKSAQRLSKQTGTVVICISDRRNVITIYRGEDKYVLRDTDTILARANQALQTLKRYRVVLDEALNSLSVMEFENIVTMNDVLSVIQRIELVSSIVEEVGLYIVELGEEGRLISMQLGELRSGVEDNEQMVLLDYIPDRSKENVRKTTQRLRELSYDELLNLEAIGRIIGFKAEKGSFDVNLIPRGYRILGKISKVPVLVAHNLVEKYGNLHEILSVPADELVNVDGIGEVRAGLIRDGLKRIKQQVLLESINI